ncbi:MAG: T9SS type A sorting domain-containing protein [candidate division Zixibacteria bacterium]
MSRGYYIFAYVLLLLLILVSESFSQDSLWAASYGGLYNDCGNSSVQMLNGDILILGSTYSFGAGEHDMYLVKTDSTGNLIWQKSFGGTGIEYGYDIVLTSDNGFALVGSTTSYGAGKRDIYLVKLDESGNELWSKTFGGIENDYGRSIRECGDNGLIICGTTSSYGSNTDIYLIKTNSSGDSLWAKTYGGSAGETGASIRETSDNGFAIVGNTGSYGVGYCSIYLVRTDSLGDTLWTSSYGNDRADLGNTIEITNDKGYIIGGATVEDGDFYYNAYAVKLDSLGTVEWDSTYGGNYEDQFYSIQLTPDGGYIYGGSTEGSGSRKIDMFVIKVDGGGNTEWNAQYGGNQSDYCNSIIPDGGNDFHAIGYTYSSTNGGSDVYIVKLQGSASTPVEETLPLSDNYYELSQNYPNPFNASTTISFTLPRASNYTLTIYNILGQAIRQWEDYIFSPGTYSIIWDGQNGYGENAATGIYIYRLQTEKYSEVKQMILIK